MMVRNGEADCEEDSTRGLAGKAARPASFICCNGLYVGLGGVVRLCLGAVGCVCVCEAWMKQKKHKPPGNGRESRQEIEMPGATCIGSKSKSKGTYHNIPFLRC